MTTGKRPRPHWRYHITIWNALVIIMFQTSFACTGNVLDPPPLLSVDQTKTTPTGETILKFITEPYIENMGSLGGYKRENHANSIDVEEEEAIILESICFSVAGALRSSFRFTALAIRRTGDTIAGVISGVVKAVAGAFKLSADGIWIAAMRLAQPRAPDDRMPHLFDHAGRKVAQILRTIANVLYGVSEACILTGETTEALTTGLGQAVEDSFNSLEVLCSFLQRGLTFLLDTSGGTGMARYERSTGERGRGSSIRGRREEDEFHQQKRLAVLHADQNSRGTMIPPNKGKLPLRPRVPSLLPEGINSNPVNRSGHQTAGGIEKDVLSLSTGTGTGTGKGDIPDATTSTVRENTSTLEKGEEEVEVEDEYEDMNTNPPPPPPLSWSWFSNYLYGVGSTAGDKKIGRSSPMRQRSGRKAFFCPFELRTLFHTIGRWERYFSPRTSEEYLSYYSDSYSLLLLLLHVCGSWICGPWISHSETHPTKVFNRSSSASLFSTPVSLSASWTEIMGLHSGVIEHAHSSAPILLGLLIVAVASSFKYKSAKRKMTVVGSLVTLIWLCLTASEHVGRSILATRAAVDAVNSLMLSRVARSGTSTRSVPSGSAFAGKDIGRDYGKEMDRKRREVCTGLEKGDRFSADDVCCSGMNSHDASDIGGNGEFHGGQGQGQGRNMSTLDFETSVWINVIMASLWGVERNGGLGPYISNSIQEMVNEELALVPPGIANIQLKRFTLGTQTPIIQAVKVQSKRASICITPADQPTQRRTISKKWGYVQGKEEEEEEEEMDEEEGIQRMVFNRAAGTEASRKTKTLVDDGMQEDVKTTLYAGKSTDKKAGTVTSKQSGGSKEWSQWREWQSEWDRRHTKSPSSTTPQPSSPSSSQKKSKQSRNDRRSSSSDSRSSASSVIRRAGGGSGCERLVVDLDLTYVSREMDIVLTLRSSDVRSVLPEATVTLSGVVLAGILRLDAELTPDYPFLGNATVSVYSIILSFVWGVSASIGSPFYYHHLILSVSVALI